MGTAPREGRRTGDLGHAMHADTLDRIIQGIQSRVAELEQRAGEGSAPEREVLTAALTELSTAMDELRGAEQELRAQNSELEAALANMDLERQRYQDLFEFAPDGYLVTDSEGVIHEANASAERLLRAPAEDLIGRPLAAFIAYDDRPAFTTGLERLRQGERLEDWQVRLQPRPGTAFDAALTAAGARPAEGRPATLRWVIRDITERKAAEVRARLAAIAESSSDAIIGLSLEGIITAWNDGARSLYGYAPEEVIGQPMSVLLPPGSEDEFARSLERLQRGEAIDSHDTVRVQKNGQLVDVSVSLSSVRDATGAVVGASNIGRDITARRQAERTRERLLAENERLYREVQRQVEEALAGRERLREMSRRLVAVQEDERRRIARELHDELGQSLTGLRLLLQLSQDEPAQQARKHVQEAQALATELMNQVRELSLELQPVILDDLGLLQALAWHFGRYTAQTQIPVLFRHAGLEGRRFAPEIETAAYRMVQEGLTNVARHAGAAEAAVRVWANPEALRVQVEDRGAGFDPQQALAGRTGGLSGMRERAALQGAELVIESAPGEGTRLTVEFALPDSGPVQGEPPDRPEEGA